MAISMLDNISYRGQKADNERSMFDTVANMVAYSENYLPKVYITTVAENGLQYKYQRSNPIDETLGRWRVVEGSGDLTNYYNKNEIDELLEDKVDVEEDMGLSHNDYTDTEKQTLEDLNTFVDKDIVLTTTATTITTAINELVDADAEINDKIDDIEEEIEKLQKTPAIAVDEKPTYNEGVITYVQDGETKTTEDANQWFYYSVDTALYQTIWINGIEKTIESGGVDFDEFVKKENIIDTLDSVATDKPLSANMGKKLNDDMTQGLSEKLDIQQDIDKAGYTIKVDDEGKLALVESGECTASGTSYENEDKPLWDNVKKALDGLITKVFYVKPEITLFTSTPSTLTYEVGSTVDSIIFDWTLNKDVTSQTLTDCVVDADDRTATYSTPLTTSKTFTLTVGDGEETATKSIAIAFQNKAYWGSASVQETYDSAFILGLASNKFATNYKGSYQMTVGSGEYGFIAVPKSFNIPSETYIGGFLTDLYKVGDISFTNASGGVVTYTILKTGKSGLGNITMEFK